MRFKINIVFTIINIMLGMIIITQLMGKAAIQTGEPSYALTAIALERGLTTDIIEEDFNKAKLDFPEFAKEFGQERVYKIVKGDREVYSGYYAGTYSLSIIPIKKILELIGVSQSYAFMITNVVIFSISVIFFINTMRIKFINKIISFIILIFNPILFYMSWQSAEVFIYSMLVISLTFFINEKYKRASIFAFLAATLNITLIFYQGIIVLTYIIKKYENISEKRFIKRLYDILKRNWGTLLYFCILIVWSVISFFGSVFERVNQNVLFDEWLSRFLAYLFDLNLGMLPHYGIIIVMIVIGGIKAFRQKNIKFYLIVSAFLLTVLAYSIKPHINSGSTYIARYNSWSAALLIFAAIIYINGKRVSKKELLYYLIGGTSTLVIVFLHGAWIPKRVDYTYFMPTARFVLDKFPGIYRVNKQIFSTRVLHSESIGYQNSDDPIIYVSKRGYVTKVLLRKELLEELDKYITIETDKLMNIKEHNKNNKKDYIFIDFREKDKITKIKNGGNIHE